LEGASPATTLDRMELAQWLVDRRNPLTARVAVNRIWQVYFGRGLVETDNDFGTQGSPPSHPELLDWLACELMDHHWSLKPIHRLIVSSATYRQSSRLRPEGQAVDPETRLLWRQPRLRLDAELIRDAALAGSGLLTRVIGGPSVFPPQPAGVFRFTQVPREWKASAGADRFRRGLYTYFWRAAPHPALTVFDAPDAVGSCTRRIRSNTPLQALTLLNDEAFLEFAQALAARVLKEAPADDAGQLRYLFRLCLARPPNPTESQRLTSFLAQELHEFRQAPAEARVLVPAQLPAGTDAPRLAAWTAVARVLLNLDEFITRE
jgi:hypothetical protein